MFDLCMETYKTLSVEYREIYDAMDSLKENKNIDIVILLGNHDIPVNNTYPEGIDQNNEDPMESFEDIFKISKNNFFDKFENRFENQDGIPAFFTRDRFCQYLVLENSDDGAKLILFDSINDMVSFFKSNNEGNCVDIISLENMAIAHRRMFLFAHGHQFDDEDTVKAARYFWKKAVNTKYRRLKRATNILYNKLYKRMVKISPQELTKQQLMDEILKQLEEENMAETDLDKEEREMIEQMIPFIQEILKLEDRSKLNDKLGDIGIGETIFFRDQETKMPFKKKKTTYHRIRKFLKRTGLTSVNYIIFGHSHDEQQEYKKILDSTNGIEFVNDGAWQHKNGHPTYVMILKDGFTRYDIYS